jgi:hypothetical protein
MADNANTPPVVKQQVYDDLPLLTEDEYSSALAEIKSLFGTKPGSSEEKRLCVLTELVHNYEQAKMSLHDDDDLYNDDPRSRKPQGKKITSFRKGIQDK